MWTLFTAAAALGWAPADPVDVRLPGPPIALGALPDARGALLLAFDGHRLLAVQGGGDIVDRVDVDGNDLLVADLDEDGRPEVLLCRDDGVHAVPTVGRTLGAPIRLAAEPCRALAKGRASRGGEVVFTGAAGSRSLSVTDGTLLVEDLGLAVEGEPLLAATSATIAVGERGARSLQLLEGGETSLLPLGGPLVAVSSVGDELAWVEGDGPSILHLGRSEQDVGTAVAGLAGLRLDGVDTVVAWGEGGWTLPDWPGPAGRPLLADLDADGCADLVVASHEGYSWSRGQCEAVVAVAESPFQDVAPSSPLPPPATSRAAGWPPSAWTDGDRVTDRDLPTPPDILVLDDNPTLVAFVGQPVEVHLQPRSGRVDQLHGQPPGAHLEGGALMYLPEAWDIGVWHVAARSGAGRWRSFVMEVWPRPQAGDPIPAPPTLHATASSSPPPPGADRWFHIDDCLLGVGGAAGASRSGGLIWEDLGSPQVTASASPAVALICDGGGTIQWVLGVDAAPWFRYTDLPADRSHLIGATAGIQLGTERFRAGPYGSAGVTAINLGARAQGFWSGRTGLELRAGWLAPRAGVEAMALVLVRLGSRPKDEKTPAE